MTEIDAGHETPKAAMASGFFMPFLRYKIDRFQLNKSGILCFLILHGIMFLQGLKKRRICNEKKEFFEG